MIVRKLLLNKKVNIINEDEMRALIYARGAKSSIECQIEICKKHCQNHNIEVVNCYSDEGTIPSARKSKFKGFLELIENLKDEDCIACIDNTILPDFYKQENLIIDDVCISYLCKGINSTGRKVEYCGENFLNQRIRMESFVESEIEKRVLGRLNIIANKTQSIQSAEEIKEYLFLKNKVMARLVTDGCVRHSLIEELHGGKSPITKTGDFSDVKVIYPGGEIAWSELSKISDYEMRQLMLEIEGNINKIFNLFFVEHTNENLLDLNVSVSFASQGHSYLSILNDSQKLKMVENYLFSTSGVSWDNPTPYYDASSPDSEKSGS